MSNALIYGGLGALAVFVGFQLFPLLRAAHQKGQPAPDISDLLPEGMDPPEKLLIYFTSPSCGACVGMTRVVDRLMASHDNLIKINVHESLDVARRFNVMATPTLVVIRNGMIDKVILGATGEGRIRALLSR